MSATAEASASSRSKRRSFDLADGRGHERVVDRVFQPVARAAVTDLEGDVVEEQLAALLLLGLDAVVSVQLEPSELHLHAPTTARAAASASTCSRTSWARMIVAPRS